MKRTRGGRLAGGLLAVGLALNACGGDGTDGSTAAGSAPTGTPTPAGTVAAGSHNDADLAFVSMMVPHHAQAIKMSDLILARDDVDPEVRDFATAITAVQGPQADQLRGWLAGWADPNATSDGDMDMSAMGGMDHAETMPMLSTDQMDKVRQASPEKATRLYLDYMVAHHTSAVEMAQTEMADGANAEAVEMAAELITAQAAQIADLDALLAG